MKDLIVILILVAIVAAIVIYLIRQKKRGVHCIGCPHGGSCGKSKGCNCGNQTK